MSKDWHDLDTGPTLGSVLRAFGFLLGAAVALIVVFGIAALVLR